MTLYWNELTSLSLIMNLMFFSPTQLRSKLKRFQVLLTMPLVMENLKKIRQPLDEGGEEGRAKKKKYSEVKKMKWEMKARGRQGLAARGQQD